MGPERLSSRTAAACWRTAYDHWACGNWVPDCSTARSSFLCEHKIGALKIGYGLYGASVTAIGVLTGNSLIAGCGIGITTGAILSNDASVGSNAIGGCVAGGGAASGRPIAACFAGYVGVAEIGSGDEFDGLVSCLAGATGAATGVSSPSRSVAIPVSQSMENVVQCLTSAAAAAATNGSDFSAIWAALMGCTAGIGIASVDAA